MASLIVLSSLAIPIGNMNLFSDVMASGKNHDKYDNYQEYDKSYYSDNDNQYTPDYNYYYEPMKQQQQQSSYDNNYYNYNDKKISYSDSYEDMKTYSTYPTKDKKYVCQTGQFKGFFVESVEFCKLKIAQGPPGPAGPQGIQGLQGPRGFNGTNGVNGTSGITMLNNINTYLVTVSVVNVALTNTIGQANCSSGDFVINGGFTIVSVAGGAQNPFEVFNRPILSPLGNGWEVLIVPDTPAGIVTYSVHAICFDNSP